MKKLCILSILFTGIIISGSQIVTSPLKGWNLSYVPQEGQVIKQGEVLVKFDTASIEAQISDIEAQLKEADSVINVMKSNLKRYKQLANKKATSIEYFENIDLNYDKARYDVSLAKSIIESYKAQVKMAAINAPFDCKVTKVVLAQGSGVDYGSKIIEIEKSSVSGFQEPNSETTDNTRFVTSYMHGGLITYLADEGAIVKKDEKLATTINPVSDAQFKGYEAAVDYAKHILVAATSNYNRYAKLKGSASSIEDAEHIELAYEKAKKELILANKDIEYQKIYNEGGTILAPFDCKVTRVIGVLNGGTKAGETQLLAIEPTNSVLNSYIKNNVGYIMQSSIDEQMISYLPEQGHMVKKGEKLIGFEPSPINLQIEQAKLNLLFAETNLKNKEKDYKRCTYLTDKKSVAQEICDIYLLDFDSAKAQVDKCKAKVKYYESEKDKFFINAPYDCKVTRVFLIVNGGVKYGTPLLKIETL